MEIKTCQFGHLAIGDVTRMSANPDSNCRNCNFTWGIVARMSYEGHKTIDGAVCDVFKFIDEVYCPECGDGPFVVFYVPCGGTYSLQLTEANELIDVM